MTKCKTAAVGEYSSVSLFRATGIRTVSVSNKSEAKDAVLMLVKDKYELIFITENFSQALEEELEVFRRKAYPVILSIPDRNGSSGYGMQMLIRNMEKAIGTNLFKEK